MFRGRHLDGWDGGEYQTAGLVFGRIGKWRCCSSLLRYFNPRTEHSYVELIVVPGMYACTFWSMEEPSLERGYPIELPVVIASVAILTCMASTGLLAHSATIARDKLAEVLYTRRRLW